VGLTSIHLGLGSRSGSSCLPGSIIARAALSFPIWHCTG